MSLLLILSQFAGAIGLLLWGTHMVQTGIQRAYAAELNRVLGRALDNRLRAFLAGIGVTAILQSSTATGLMTAGFAASGAVGLGPALAVMLGANVGTTLIVQLLSFDVAVFAPALIFAGVLMFRRQSNNRMHDLSRVFIGLGLMLLALHQLLELVAAYETSPVLIAGLKVISSLPLLDLLLAAAVTWAAHSSVAVVLLVMSLAAQGSIPVEAAIAMVLGANLGTAINPLIEGPAGNDPAARRLPLGNLLTRLAGVIPCLFLAEPIAGLMMRIEPGAARAVADFHSLFNILVALVFLPLLTPYARLILKVLPDRVDANDPSRPVYLEPSAREIPIVALGAAGREALRLADVLSEMLTGARDVLSNGSRRLTVETRRRDDILDRLNTAIEDYLTAIDPEEMSDDEQRRLREILSFSMNLEQAGDAVDLNLLPHAMKRLKRGIGFSAEERAELTAQMDRLIANLATAASLMMTADERIARRLADEKTVFRAMEVRAIARHLDILRNGRFADAQASALYVDLLRDMKLINGFIVAAAAYPILERSGALLPTRVDQASG